MEVDDNLRLAVFEYLERNNYIDSLKTFCERFQSKTQTLFPLDIEVNPIDLLQDNAYLGHFVLSEPISSQQLFNEVICEMLMRLNLLHSESVNRVLVTVRIVVLPPFPEFEISTFRELATKISKKGYYRLTACYVCSNTICAGFNGKKFTKIHAAGDQEKQTVSDSFKCITCGSNLQENIKERVLSDKVIASMLPLTNVSHSRNLATVAQAINVYFRDSLVEKIRIGQRYRLTAMPVVKPCANLCEHKILALEANYLEDWTSNIHQNMEFYSQSFWNDLHRFLYNFHIEDFSSCPYITLMAMAFSFAVHVAPKGHLIKVKMGIILNLVTCGHAMKKKSESLLIIGQDSTIIDRLLRYCASFVPTFIPLTMHGQLHLSTRRDVSGTLFVDANPLVLAASGICYLGDLGKFPSAAKRALVRILDSRTIPLDSHKLTSDSSSFPLTYPLECQIWAYSIQKRPPETFPELQKVADTEHLSKLHILDEFGFVYYTDFMTVDGSVQKDELREHRLNVAMDDISVNELLSENKIRQCIEFAMHQGNLKFQPETETLIQGYFVASRRVRGSLENSHFPLSALLAITGMSEAHAKLNCRRVVTVHDAILAVYLYEESITTRFGMSPLHVQPSPHLFGFDTSTQIKKLIADITQFGKSLQQFVDAYGSIRKIQNPEE